MTRLTKEIRRKAILHLDHRATPRPMDDVTVALTPDKLIGFRAGRAREWHHLPLEAVYAMAVKATARRKAEERKKAKAERKKARG